MERTNVILVHAGYSFIVSGNSKGRSVIKDCIFKDVDELVRTKVFENTDDVVVMLYNDENRKRLWEFKIDYKVLIKKEDFESDYFIKYISSYMRSEKYIIDKTDYSNSFQCIEEYIKTEKLDDEFIKIQKTMKSVFPFMVTELNGGDIVVKYEGSVIKRIRLTNSVFGFTTGYNDTRMASMSNQEFEAIYAAYCYLKNKEENK